jgi:hypothetical protein
MSRKRYTPEQIIGKLREAEVALSQGETDQAMRKYTEWLDSQILQSVDISLTK